MPFLVVAGLGGEPDSRARGRLRRNRMKSSLGWLRCVLVFVPVLAALAAPATTAADTISKDVSVERSFAFSEPSCVPDEFLALTGTVRDRFVLRMDNSGGLHLDDYHSVHGSGSGFGVEDFLMQSPISSYVASDDALTTTNIA